MPIALGMFFALEAAFSEVFMPTQIAVTSFNAKDQRLLGLRGLSPDDEASFASLLARAQGVSPADRQSVLNGLTASELETLRKAHSLADPINPAGLSQEGVYNLFQAPSEAKDLDHDGFQSVGIAKMWCFPPPDAPESLRKAWEASTAGLSDGEVMLKMGIFLPPPQFALDGNGNLLKVINPGDPEWKDPYGGSGFSWQRVVQGEIDGNELGRAYNTTAHYLETKNFLSGLMANLKRFGVA